MGMIAISTIKKGKSVCKVEKIYGKIYTIGEALIDFIPAHCRKPARI